MVWFMLGSYVIGVLCGIGIGNKWLGLLDTHGIADLRFEVSQLRKEMEQTKAAQRECSGS
jgi:hypothetical protein